MPPRFDDASDPLCCCEYYASDGSRSHLLGICCDCEELDDACDRLISGRWAYVEALNHSE